MKIDKRRIENANEFGLLSIKVLSAMGLFVGFVLGLNYLLMISYWFGLLIIPLMWIIGYFIVPNTGDV